MNNPKVDEIMAKMACAIGSNSGGSLSALDGTLKFDFGDCGSVFIDGKSGGVTSGEGKTADCTITVSLEDFEKMVRGELDGTSAFMQGKLRVAGDMGLSLKIGPILQKARG